MGEDEYDLPRGGSDGNEITESDVGETVKTDEIDQMFTEENMDDEDDSAFGAGTSDLGDDFDDGFGF